MYLPVCMCKKKKVTVNVCIRVCMKKDEVLVIHKVKIVSAGNMLEHKRKDLQGNTCEPHIKMPQEMLNYLTNIMSSFAA